MKVGQRVFVFSAKYSPTPEAMTVNAEAFIRSVKITYDATVNPTYTKDIFLKPIRNFGMLEHTVVGQEYLITHRHDFQSLTGQYPKVETAKPDNSRLSSGRDSECYLLRLSDFTLAQRVVFKRQLYDVQLHNGSMTSIEAESIGGNRGHITYYLHKHNIDAIQESKRIRIPMANLKRGEQHDMPPRYDAVNDRVHLVSQVDEIVPRNSPSRVPKKVHLIRQVDMKSGETKPPIELFGFLLDYALSHDGKQLYVHALDNLGQSFPDPTNRFISPERGIIVINTETWKITDTYKEDARKIQHIAFHPLDDGSMLVVRVLAGPTQPRDADITMQCIRPSGRVDAISFDRSAVTLPFLQAKPELKVELSSDRRFGILGPLQHGELVRFRLDLETRTATATDATQVPALRKEFFILPDDKRVILTPGTVAHALSAIDHD